MKRGHLIVPIVALVVLSAACGGSAVPEGNAISVRYEVVESILPVGVPQAGPSPQPLTVRQTESDWRRVSRLLPDPLPDPVDQGSDCGSGGSVIAVRLVTRTRDNGEVVYGPCRRPKAIEPVLLLMQTLLQRRVAADRRCKCP